MQAPQRKEVVETALCAICGEHCLSGWNFPLRAQISCRPTWNATQQATSLYLGVLGEPNMILKSLIVPLAVRAVWH